MIWVLIVPLIVLYLVLQKAASDTRGHARSRRSYRRQRKVARELGISPEALDYHARQQPAPKPFKLSREANIVVGVLAALLWLAILWPH